MWGDEVWLAVWVPVQDIAMFKRESVIHKLVSQKIIVLDAAALRFPSIDILISITLPYRLPLGHNQ